jgi:hypothetical protein
VRVWGASVGVRLSLLLWGLRLTLSHPPSLALTRPHSPLLALALALALAHTRI